jgi:hypothetical protein
VTGLPGNGSLHETISDDGKTKSYDTTGKSADSPEPETTGSSADGLLG